MLRPRALLALLFLLLLSACAPLTQTLAPPAPTLAPTFAPPTSNISSLSSQFDSRRALEHNRVLAVTIGSRVAGSEAGARAGDYIAQQLASYGYAVERQAFNFEAWEDRGTRVQVITPEIRNLDARPIQYSPGGNLAAQVVAIEGVGSEEDFAQVDAKGKIALVQRGTIPFSDKARNAEKAGAVAAIIYNNAPGGFGGTLRDRVAIPALTLSGRDGQILLELLSRGVVKVMVDSSTLIDQKIGHNIIGTKRGAADATIVLGGHYDSVSAGPGANDNGSGTGVLVELARVLAQKEHRHTRVFIAFDGEEFGLIGSQYYVEHLTAGARGKIVAMLNFDMLGGGSGPLLAGGDGRLGQLTRDAASQLAITARNFSLGSGAGSDHAPFQRAGIDTVFFSRDYDLLHTPNDVIEQVREEYLAEAGRVAERVVGMLEEK